MRVRTVGAALVATAVITVGGLAAGASPAASRTSAIAPGVAYTQARYGGHRPQRIQLVRVNLADPHVHLAAELASNLLGGPRQTVLTMSRIPGAIAAINGDFFDTTVKGALPVGGLVVGGRLIKTPRPGTDANFSIAPNGRAAIGPFAFQVTITRAAIVPILRPATSRPLFSVNSLRDARAGHITLVDDELAAGPLHASCTVATAQVDAQGGQVTSVASGVTSLPQFAANEFALVGCGDTAPTRWLGTQLQPGDPISLSGPIDRPSMLVSGGRQLVRHGARFDDTYGRKPEGVNPVTFACVSGNGRSVLFGVVDGRSRRSRGMSYAQLTDYLLRLRCWDGMTFDGGGSSTMVARVPHRVGKRTVDSPVVVNDPSDGHPRKVADAIVVYRS